MIKTNGGFLISQIKQIQGRVLERMLTDAGIDEFNGAQGRILYVLWQEDNLPIAELSKRTGLAKNTLTTMLDRMENAGHIKRIPDSNDRRQIRITLTDSAHNLEEKYNQVSDRMTALFYEEFTDDEIIVFEDTLKRILDNLTKNNLR